MNKNANLAAMLTVQQAEQEIVDEFELFDDWADKYQYIIEIGQKLPSLSDEYKNDSHRIKGCQSSVWLHAFAEDGTVFFEADSDSTFVKGEIALLIRVLSGKNPDEIINAELNFIDEIGLRQHVAVTRANGLAAMIKQMKLYAIGLKSKEVKSN